MKLTIAERLIISGLIPQEGTYESLIVGRDLKKKVDLTQSEIVKYNFRTEFSADKTTAAYMFDSPEKEFEIGLTDAEVSQIESVLKTLQEKKKLTMDHLGLFEKICK